MTKDRSAYSLNLGGKLMSLEEPRVMGILNVTPDSFYAGSRKMTEAGIAQRVGEIIAEGADIIDIGGCSTRPGSEPVGQEGEMARLRMALSLLRQEWPEAIVSVDTFRADVARMAVEEYGAAIINDISGGKDEGMFPMVARLGVAYVLMSSAPDIGSMLIDLAGKTDSLRALGAKDIIVDPGFGFGKDVRQNYSVLSHMDRLAVLGLPVLAALSRKRMIYQLLDISPDEALSGTIVANTMALMHGASLLRVHDVRAAREACTIYTEYKTSSL